MRFSSSAFAALEVLSLFTLASAQSQQKQNQKLQAAAQSGPIKIHKIYATTWNGTLYLEPSSPNITFVANATYPEKSINSTDTTPFVVGVDIKDRRDYQVVQGVGAGVTDGASIVLQALKQNNPTAYWEVLNLAFNQSPEEREKGGAAMDFIRIPLGASDSGFVEYSYADSADGSPDLNLTQFTIEKAPKMWATIKDILSIHPGLKIFAAPWTPPPWMKTNGKFRGGSVKPEYEQVWSEYLCRAMTDIRKKLGTPVIRLSLQSEPLYEAQNYPSCSSTPEQQARIGKLVRACLDKGPSKETGIVTYDHNWDRPDFPKEVFDRARDAFVGVAWHCFVGDPSGQQVFNRAYTDAEVYMTQCTRATQFLDEPWRNLKKSFSQLVNGSIGYDSEAIILWNLALEVSPDGFTTPQLPGASPNSLAPILLYPNVTARDPAAMLPGQTAPMSTDGDKKARRSLGEGHNPLGMHRRAVRSAAAPFGGQEYGLERRQSNIPHNNSYWHLTSDYAILTHISLAVNPTFKGEMQGRRIGVKTTEDYGVEGNGRGGRVAAQVFRTDNADIHGNSKWTIMLLQQQDFYDTGYVEDVTVSLRFRGAVANITVGPGLYNIEFYAPKDAP